MAGGVTTRTGRSAVARRARNLRRACGALVPALLLCLGVTEVAFAQDIEPRRWTHLPDGTSTLAIGYAGRDADIYFNPLIGITDGTAALNAWVARFTHAFGWGGNTARFDVIVPYVSGTWQGLVDGVPGRRSITAGGDPWLRLSVNFSGSPALRGDAFREYLEQNRVRTTYGASLAVSPPWGGYDPSELINVGRNRYAVRPQFGVVHVRGPWSYELTGSVFLFSDNDDFVESVTLSQEPVWAAQAHVTRNVLGRGWLGVGLAYAVGGKIDLDGERVDYRVDNVLWNLVGGYRLTKHQSVMVAWQQGRTQVDVGQDSDSWLLSWVYAWGG